MEAKTKLEELLNSKPRRKLQTPAKKVWLHRLEQVLKLAGDTGSILSSLQQKPNLINYIGLAFKTLSTALSIRSEYKSWKKRYPYYAFNDSDKWELIPPEYKGNAVDLSDELEVLEEHWNGAAESSRPIIVKIKGEVIGWTSADENPDNVEHGPYLLKIRKDQTISAIGKAMWEKIGTRYATFTYSGIMSDPETEKHNLPLTKPFQDILENIKKYLNHRITRSILIQGAPGTGKSCGAMGLVKALNFSSLRIDLGVLCKNDNNLDILKIIIMVRSVNPEVVIIDDLDRVGSNINILNMLQELNKNCKLIIGTANFPENMIGAMLRPERFDEIVKIEHLDRKTVEEMVYVGDDILFGIDSGLIDQLLKLPIVYITEFIKRKKVLGMDEAKKSLPELMKRADILATSDSLKTNQTTVPVSPTSVLTKVTTNNEL
jgi:hypothetical protein